MGTGPSINDAGTVAFVGDFPTGAQGLFTADGNSLQNINPSFSNDPNLNYGDPVEINDSGTVLAVDRVTIPGYTQYTLRTWNASATSSYQIDARGGAPRGPLDTFDGISAYAAIDNNGDVVYSALDDSSSTPIWDLEYQTSTSASGSNIATLTNPQALRPVISDNPFIVARIGGTNSTADPLTGYQEVGGASKVFGVAGPAKGFDQLGPAPGISADGQVIAFAGALTAAGAQALGLTPGPGIFARVVTNGTPTYVRVAGATAGMIQSFDLTQPVGANDNSVVFLATDANGQEGLFTAPINVPGSANTTGANQPTELTEMAEVGGTITAGTTSLQITGLSIHDPINNSGQIAFWANTSQGNVILRAEPPPTLSVTTADTIDSGPSLAGASLVAGSPGTVSADAASISVEGTFGPYLVGIPYMPNFIATVSDDTTNSVTGVTYSIDNGTPINAKPLGNHQWSVPYDVGKITDASEPHTLTVATTGFGTPMTMTYTLDMRDSLDYQLTATYPGGPSAPEDVSGLRFIQGIDLTPKFTGTISDLPFYYVKTLQVRLSGSGVTQPSVDIQSTGGSEGAQFNFSYDTAELPGDEQTSVELLFQEPSGVYPWSEAPPMLNTINLPVWMANPKSQIYDPGSASYVIDLKYPSAFQASLSSIAPADAGFLSGLASAFLDQPSSFGLGVNLEVTAKLTTNPGDALLSVENWFVNATIFGHTLLDKGSPFSSNLINVVQGTLDPLTLAAPSGIKLTTNEIPLSIANQTLFDQSFGTGSLPLLIPTPPALKTSVSLSGELQGFVRDLSIQAGLQLDVSGDSPTLVQDGTFVEVKASGGVGTDLKLGASLGIVFVNTPLISATVGGIVAAIAEADVKVNFSGPITGPITHTPDMQNSRAGLTLAYGVDYDYATGSGTPELHPDYEHVQVPLFGLKAPPLPDLSSLDNLLNGPGKAQSNGLPGVSPSVGQVMSILGSVSPDPSATIQAQTEEPVATSVRAAAVTSPRAQLTVAAPVYAPLSDLKFDLNILSDHAVLTPGDHTLDVVLVGLDGSEVPLSHIDLAATGLSANSNPLGYASGWSTIDVPVGNTQLVAGLPYQVEFLLTTDASTSGESVAVALDNLVVTPLLPALQVSPPGDTVSNGTLVFGPGTDGSTSATVVLTDNGTVPLHGSGLMLSGTGFTLRGTDTGPFILYPGQSTDIPVSVVDPTQSASGSLQISTDDLTQPMYILALQYYGTSTTPPNQPPVLAPIPDQSLSPGGTVTLTASATDPDSGRTLTYSLDPGAPAGAAIDPASGAFTWSVPAGELPGDYPVTVRVTDNGSPPLSATQMFAIDVPRPTSLAVARVNGIYQTTTAFAATLAAAGAPLAGAAVTLTITAGGQTIPLGIVTTDASGVASLSGVSLAGVPAGSYPSGVIASFGGDSSDAPTVASGGLTITQATPTVTWATPPDTTQGQALGSAQLDAIGSVAGTFAYTPAAGTVLPAAIGQTLTAVFTPSDSTDYTSVTVSTTLNVLSRPDPTVTPSASTANPLAGLPLTFTVLVAPPASGDPAPTGTVQFELDGNPLGSAVALTGGAATSASTTLTDGAHTVTAVYSGDSAYSGAPGSLTLTASIPTATVEVAASSPSPIAGQAVTLTATVAPTVSDAPTPTGSVQFEVDGSAVGKAVTLAGGAATSGSVTLAAGSHAVTAVYSGNSTYAATTGSITLTAVAIGNTAPGSLDPGFGNQGLVPLKLGATNVAFDAQGRILVTGAGTVFRDELGLSRYTADGQPDHSFGSLGTVVYGSGTGEGVAVEPDGKIVCIYAQDSGDVALVRFYDDGAIDTTFGTDGVVQLPSFTLDGITAPFFEGSLSGNFPVRVATLSDGRILLAGAVAFTGVSYGCGLAMYLPDGQLDPSFNGTGTLLTGPTDPVDGFAFNNLWNLAVDNNEILLFLNGEIPGVQAEHIRLYEFNLDGTKNTMFGTNGEVIIQDNDGTVGDQVAYYHYSYPAMALAPDGKIVVAYFNNLESYNAPGNEILLRYDPNGSPDATFGSGGRASVANFAVPFSEGGIGGSLAIEPDGKFLLIGDLGTGIVRVNSDGNLDTTFGTGGMETIPQPPSADPDLHLVAVEPSGRILALPS